MTYPPTLKQLLLHNIILIIFKHHNAPPAPAMFFFLHALFSFLIRHYIEISLSLSFSLIQFYLCMLNAVDENK